MKTAKATMYACFMGYIVQAIINNFIPLLFLTFEKSYGIPIGKITFLVTMNFGLQLLVDLASVSFVDKVGYRISMIFADIMAALGLIFLAVLPNVMDNSYIGLMISVITYSIGGGLIEVLVSPIMESCPSENKAGAMSLLHSFYCWGHVGVVLISTLFFAVVGIDNWYYLAIIWAVIPLVNAVLFSCVPIYPLVDEGEEGLKIKQLIKNTTFWILVILMLCAGASEQAVSQWVSAFVESGLKVTKTIGDLAGPMFFAIMMGISRIVFSKISDKYELKNLLVLSGLLCIVSFLVITLSPVAIISLLGFGLCGFSVGAMWPGAFSLSAKAIKNGGTAMFALLALAGDLGCTAGPTIVGEISDFMGNNLKYGIACAIIFPVIFVVILLHDKQMIK